MKKPQSKPTRESYIVLQDWMIRDLRLTGDELIVYALIYGFSQDNNSCFRGSLRYISYWTGRCRTTILKILAKLQDRGLVLKKEIPYTGLNPGCHYCEYRAIRHMTGV